MQSHTHRLSAVAMLSGLLLIAPPAPAADSVEAKSHATNVPLYGVFELGLTHDHNYANPFFDATVELTFTAPSGAQYKVGGFYYGSDEKPQIVVTQQGDAKKVRYVWDNPNLWKARFAPNETGKWSYTWSFADATGRLGEGTGTFECVKSDPPSRGFVRINPKYPYRLVFDDGSPYYPIGIQDGVFDNAAVGSVLANWAMEGPFRTDSPQPANHPAGAMFMPGPSNNPMNADVYFRTYGQCGFNMLRFSQHNFSLDLVTDLDHYLPYEAAMVDEYLRHARKYDFRVFYGIFGYLPVFADKPENAEGMAKVRRFIKYSVDRWGAYVDIWELLNEQHAGPQWYAQTAPYLHEIDPYKHPVSTSWERPELDSIDINSPHWYQNEDPLQSHARTAALATKWKKHSKPVILGEQGNEAGRDRTKRPPGVGGVWDIRSAERMRVRCWTAYFNEIAFVFWVTNYAKDGHHMNIWLGPQERQYVRALQDFCYRMDADTGIAEVAASRPSRVRAYGLSSEKHAAVYLVHTADRGVAIREVKVWVKAPADGKGYWYDPATAAILGTFDAKAGMQVVIAPPFKVDLALLITPDGPPDIDGDGKPNDIDDDDDNDGTPDAKDAFMLDPSEWADSDGDRIGDNMDADDDGDGVADDNNRNGKPDNEEMDFDGDGVPKAGAVPFDAFPFDPAEWADSDGDGIGDNADKQE